MSSSDLAIGKMMHSWASDMWSYPRSITGEGVRQTLQYIQDVIPSLKVHSVPTGTKVFDWTVPEEWVIDEAYIEDEFGNRVVDFKENNLHILGYSIPTNQWLALDELKKYLYTLPDQPEAIPYVTSYYVKRWGFCLSQNQLESLPDKKYHAVIKSELKQGVLNYGEILIKGERKEEIFLSTYICHPSMANNELSGPVVAMALANWLASQDLRYSYRIVFIPETIGSITYLSRNLDYLKENVIAGFNISCVGDDRCYSYLPSRHGDTLSDRVAKYVLGKIDPSFKKYTWLDRGSDERQYCSPGVDLPIATIMRSKYGKYPEYHTSLDDLNLITPTGLWGGYEAIRQSLQIIEENKTPIMTVFGEPQLGKRGLYPTISQKGAYRNIRDMMNIITYCDGKHTLLDIAQMLSLDFTVVKDIVSKLYDNELIIYT